MKKFLSLVLALIMTMSLVTISAGATEYRDLTDKEEIQYEEAVAVLNRIGVITGYEDGSFRPETELTRGAAAKIIVSLMIGPDAAAALPNNASPYPDVPAGHTFAGVIGYCKTAGYISGYGDGTFKPANPLTGYAFAKMLLGAVGYKANIEGFVDTGWTMNVARIGNVAGLFDRLDFDGAAAVTRDAACQLALNTLKATMVDYGGNNTVVSSTGEVLTVQGSKAQYVTSNNRDINANINRRVINAVNNEMTLEFGEEHFKDLRLEHDKYDPAYDVYGHPSNEWSYKKVTIGTFPLPADFTYTDQIVHREATTASKEKALGLRGYDTWSTDHRNNWANWSTASSGINNFASPFADETQVHINGWHARVNSSGVPYTDIAGRSDTRPADALTLSEIADLTDNGVTVEVYVCPVDADFITDVVVTRTQLMEIDRVAADYVRLKDIEPDSRDKSIGDITGYNAFAIDCTDDNLYSNRRIEDVKDDNYDAYKVLKDMKDGDKVAVIPYTEDDNVSWEVGVAYAPETVTGTLTRVDIYNSEAKRDGNAVAITVGGTSYKINEWNEGMLDIKSNDIKSTRKDVTLYLAKDGTALQVTDVGNAGEWMIVADYWQGTNDAGKVVWYVHGYTIGGDEVDLDLGTIRGAAEKYAPGELVRCQINTASGGGEYILTKPNGNESSVKKAGMYNLPNAVKATDGQYTHPWDAVTATSNSFTEPKRAATGTDLDKDWEGIYRVALGYDDDGTGVAKEYAVKKNSQYILLDGYAHNTSAHPTRYSEAEKATIGGNANTLAGYKWDYQDVDYASGVKFVYVSFDSAGEVESIYFADGKQDVDNRELRTYNSDWRNVGTNNDDFVATTAEAYVNDSGNVETVVIKTDSADADLSGLRIITKNTGSNNYVKSVGADATESELLKGRWTEREYVQGPDFKDNQTGIFDKEYDVGDILMGSERNGIFYAREFHGNNYRGNSLDGLYIKGIQAVKNTQDNKMKDRFSIAGSLLKTLDESITLKGAAETSSTNAAVNALLTKNEGEDVLNGRHQAGIILGGSAKIIDVRVGHEGEITKLKDLFDGDFDLDQIELKVLLNGKSGDAGFRSAYAIVILDTKDPVKYATAPEFDLEVTSDGDGDWNIDETVYEVTKGEKVTLTADLTNKDKLTTVSYSWSAKNNADDSAAKVKASGNEAVFTASAVGEYTVTLKVTNKDNKNADKDVTKNVVIKVSDAKTAGQGTVQFAKTLADDFSILGKPIFKLTEDGVATVIFRFKNPEYVSGATAVTSIKAQIKDAEGTVLYPDSMVPLVKIDASFNTTGTSYIMGTTTQNALKALLAGQNVEDLVFEITEVKYDNYDIKVVGYDGTEYKGAAITNSPYAGTKGTAANNKVVATGEAVTVKFAGADSGELEAAITGVTFANAADAKLSVTGSSWSATTASNVTPDGKGYVTITITAKKPIVVLNRITEADDIVDDLADAEDSTGTAVGTTNAITYSITHNDAAGKAYIDISLAAALTSAKDAVKLNYQLTDAEGTVVDTFTATFKNGYKATGADNDVETFRYTVENLTKSLVLSLASAEKIASPKIASVSGIEMAGNTWANGDTFKVFFSEAVDTGVTGATLTLASVDSKTLTAVIDSSGEYAVVAVGGAISTSGDSAVTFTKMQNEDGIAFSATQKLSFTDSSVTLATT